MYFGLSLIMYLLTWQLLKLVGRNPKIKDSNNIIIFCTQEQLVCVL